MISGAHVGTQLYSQNKDVCISSNNICSLDRILDLELCLGSLCPVDMVHGLTFTERQY